MANLTRFFPGLGTALPPSVPSPVQQQQASGPAQTPSPAPAPTSSPPVGAGGVHDFARSNLMVLDVSQSADVFKAHDIAKYPSQKPHRPTGSTFVTSKDLIAYVVKAGSVRVIHKESGARTLLKGHSEAVVDMTFAGSCLTTCSDDGLAIVWEILVGAGDAEAAEAGGVSLDPRETLRLRVPAGDGAQRVAFHPHNDRLIFVAHGPSVSGIRLSKSVWEAFTSLENPEDGVALEQVASYRLLGGHTQTVNDISFSADGQLIVTASEDGSVAIWAMNQAVDAELYPVSRVNLNQPVVFASFVGSSIACGFAHNEEMALISSQPHDIRSKIRFSASKAGTPVRFRSQSAFGGRFIVLCDSSSPIVVIMQLDETAFRRAVCLRVPNPIISFSLTETGTDSLEVNAVGEGMIQTLELSSLNDILPQQMRSGASPPSQMSQPNQGFAPPHANLPQPKAVYAPNPAPQPQMSFMDPRSMMPPPHSGSKLPMGPMPTTSSSMNASAVHSDLDNLIQSKLDQLLIKLEASQKAKDDLERERQLRLLEAVSTSIAQTVPDMVDKVVSAKLRSPEFLEVLSSTVKVAVDSALAKGQMDKALKGSMDKIADNLQIQLVSKLQQPINRAFEDAFRTRLVPAFEAGCRDMMSQFEESFARRMRVTQAGDGAVAEASPYERVETAIEQQNFPQALGIALSSGDPALLTSTCEKIDLSKLLMLPTHGFPQQLLMNLLSGLTTDITQAPQKRLEWIYSVALALDPASPEIVAVLPKVAKEARDALMQETALFASLGPAATRFRAVLHILVSLGGR